MGDVIEVAGAHAHPPDGGCPYAAALAAEVCELADLTGQLLEAIRRQDAVIGFLIDMSRECR